MATKHEQRRTEKVFISEMAYLERCPKCKLPMERRCHGLNETVYLTKTYYYSEWDYCGRCRHVQHYERFKVFNGNTIGSWNPKNLKSTAI